MRDIRTEAHKHFGFFSICTLVLLTVEVVEIVRQDTGD